jgi:hypothetical protein
MYKLENQRIIIFFMSNQKWLPRSSDFSTKSYTVTTQMNQSFKESQALRFSWTMSVTFLSEYMHNSWPSKSYNSWEKRIIQISNNLFPNHLVLDFMQISEWILDCLLTQWSPSLLPICCHISRSSTSFKKKWTQS